MSAIGGPLALWAAGLICAAMGLRGRRAASRPSGGWRGEDLPGAALLAMRLPCPRALARALAREGDGAEIVQAGLAGRLGADGLARMRAGGALAGVVAAAALAVLSPAASLLAPALGGLGAMAPGRWIARRRRARRAALMRELPDLLDLLGICIEAGMALDPALALAGERLGGVLGGEVATVLRDLSLGASRRDAYRALVARTGSPEVTRTVGALLQAEELGAPLSRALQGQAGALRAARRQDAREAAARAAPKIQLVVAMVMVPAVLLLVLGVLVIELSRQVGAVIG